jgi:hypothetical protein
MFGEHDLSVQRASTVSIATSALGSLTMALPIGVTAIFAADRKQPMASPRVITHAAYRARHGDLRARFAHGLVPNSSHIASSARYSRFRDTPALIAESTRTSALAAETSALGSGWFMPPPNALRKVERVPTRPRPRPHVMQAAASAGSTNMPYLSVVPPMEPPTTPTVSHQPSPHSGRWPSGPLREIPTYLGSRQ